MKNETFSTSLGCLYKLLKAAGLWASFLRTLQRFFPRPTTKCVFVHIIQGLVSVPQSALLTGKATVADASLEIEYAKEPL